MDGPNARPTLTRMYFSTREVETQKNDLEKEYFQTGVYDL